MLDTSGRGGRSTSEKNTGESTICTEPQFPKVGLKCWPMRLECKSYESIHAKASNALKNKGVAPPTDILRH